jgi:hypothetical protein
MVYVEATNDIHELMDRLESKVSGMTTNRFPEAATDPWEDQG